MFKHTLQFNNKNYDFFSPCKNKDDAIHAGIYTASIIIKQLLTEKQRKFIIFDIGANDGVTSLLISQHLNESLIYAFEPHPTIFNCLKENVKLYNKENDIKIYNFGLSNTSESLFMNKNIYETNSGCLSTVKENKKDCISVEIKTLNNFINEEHINNIDVLKIDCEGSEYDILLSFDHYDIVKYYNIEYHPHTLTKEKIDYFKSLDIFENELGPDLAFTKWLMKNLNINYENRKTRLIQ